MKKILKNLFFLCFLVVFITACNKQDASINPSKPADASSELKLSNVKLENGILVFNTKADMDSALALIERTQQIGTKWLYKQFPDYVSHNMVFNSLTKEELETLYGSTIVPDKYKEIVKFVGVDSSRILKESIDMLPFTHLANKDGFFGFGSTIVKFGSNAIYSIKKDYFINNRNVDFIKLKSSTDEVKISTKGFNNPNSVQFRSYQFLGNTQIVANSPPRRMAIYVWGYDVQIYDYNAGGYIPYKAADIWGQYEDFGCDGWFCHSTWRPNWCYGMSMSGTLSYPNNVSTGFVAWLSQISQPNYVAQLHRYVSVAFGDEPGIIGATVDLSCTVDYYTKQTYSLSFNY